jgi:4'-phosphopantetheinyl transferase
MLHIEFSSIDSYVDNSVSFLILSENEKLRAKEFLKVQDNLRFKLGRLLVRNRLSKELGLTPEKVPILIDSLGKPICPISNSLEFSISHAGSLVVVGWSDLPIGVDIEPLTALLDPNSDKLIFNTNEINSFVDLEIDVNYHRLMLFVAKEAVLKCLGLGFSVDPKLVEFKEFVEPCKIFSATYLGNIIFVKILNFPCGYLIGVASHSFDRLNASAVSKRVNMLIG